MKKLTLFFTTIGVIAFLSVLYSFYLNTEKSGYVHLQEVFQRFEGKIELQKRIQQSEWQTQLHLDSLSLHKKSLVDSMQGGKENPAAEQQIQKIDSQIKSIQQQFYNVTSKRSEDYTQQIWSQINQYVQDFGEENDFDYIFGAEGAGSVMYGSKQKNLTDAIVDYINAKYNGE